MIGVGDIVVRAYVCGDTFIPGTVISIARRNVDVVGASGLSYEEHVFTIAWCDGTITNELDLEVLAIEDIEEG